MTKSPLFVFICLSTLLLTGCAEGVFWRAGHINPWARDQWAQEEKIADTLFSQKRKLQEITGKAINAPIEDQQRAALELKSATEPRNPLLLRLHAINLLGQLKCPASADALQILSKNGNADIRLATVKAWENMPADQAISALQNILGSDTNIDVRLAATRALSNFTGADAVSAISLALEDSDPALQLRAAESLATVTGEQYGNNVQAWQNYVSGLRTAEQGTSVNSNMTR